MVMIIKIDFKMTKIESVFSVYHIGSEDNFRRGVLKIFYADDVTASLTKMSITK